MRIELAYFRLQLIHVDAVVHRHGRCSRQEAKYFSNTHEISNRSKQLPRQAPVATSISPNCLASDTGEIFLLLCLRGGVLFRSRELIVSFNLPKSITLGAKN